MKVIRNPILLFSALATLVLMSASYANQCPILQPQEDQCHTFYLTVENTTNTQIVLQPTNAQPIAINSHDTGCLVLKAPPKNDVNAAITFASYNEPASQLQVVDYLEYNGGRQPVYGMISSQYSYKAGDFLTTSIGSPHCLIATQGTVEITKLS